MQQVKIRQMQVLFVGAAFRQVVFWPEVMPVPLCMYAHRSSPRGTHPKYPPSQNLPGRNRPHVVNTSDVRSQFPFNTHNISDLCLDVMRRASHFNPSSHKPKHLRGLRLKYLAIVVVGMDQVLVFSRRTSKKAPACVSPSLLEPLIQKNRQFYCKSERFLSSFLRGDMSPEL